MYTAQTDGLRIRKMEDSAEDLGRYLGWMTDPQTMRYWEGMTEHYTCERVEREYRRHVEERVTQCFIELDGEPIGYCQFYRIGGAEDMEVPQEQYDRFIGGEESVWGVDLFIGRAELRGQGIGTRTVRLLCGELFGRYGADVIVIDPKTHNERAIRCYRKCGFEDWFVVPQRELQDGVYHDSLIMGMRERRNGIMELEGYILEENGRKSRARTYIEECGGVFAAYIDGEADGALDADFGAEIKIALGEVESWMADYRHSEYWCSPAFGESFEGVPDETQGFIYQKRGGGFGVILPLVSEQYKCVLGSNEGGLSAKLFSWCGGLNACRAPAFVFAEGDEPFSLLERCAKAGAKLLGGRVKTRDQREYPELFEYLGWCSWDAMEIRVNEEDLVRKCREFREKDIPVRWAILDDMWAEIRDFYGKEYKDRREMIALMHSSRLWSFEADPLRFPKGLAHCIARMGEYGIDVGMWHPTTGYWRGIDPEGDACKEYGEYLIKAENGCVVHSYATEKAYGFYSKLHRRFADCGAKFVKVDNQSMTRRFYKGLTSVGEAARGFHEGMERSVKENFGGAMINCMGTASEDMWNRSDSPVSRCSDDFQPEDSAWFTKHILQCAFNCLIQGQFYYCDWDMWWTDDGQAEKNSILRAISGGPIYVSDMLGRSRRETLAPLALKDGRILRCMRPAMPSADCITRDPTVSGGIFKLQSVCKNGAGMLAVFDLDRENGGVVGTVSPEDIPGLCGESFAVYEHFSRSMRIMGAHERMALTLNSRNDYRLYAMVPVVDGFAAIGRVDKFVSPATVKSVSGREVELTEPGEYAVVEDGELIFRNA